MDTISTSPVLCEGNNKNLQSVEKKQSMQRIFYISPRYVNHLSISFL